MKRTSPQAVDYRRRFLEARIERGPECWRWLGPVNSSGYGTANLVGGRTVAHRAVYELLVGSVPPEMQLDHMCHNEDAACPGGECRHRLCVNPAHLVIATPRENVSRGKTPPALNLAKETCPNGHPYARRDRRGWRKCPTCDLARQEAKRRAAGIPASRVGSSHCRHGHEYTPENTRWSKGYRYCKACDRARSLVRAAGRAS